MIIQPLTPDEVSNPKAFDFARQELRVRGADGRRALHILRICPDCGVEDWIKVNYVREKRFRGYCNVCKYAHMNRPIMNSYTSTRDQYLHYTYGLSEAQVDAMLDNQDGKCAICGETIATPHVDHSHDTGLVRGLLCKACNTGLGLLRDDPIILQKAIDYLTASIVVPGRG